MKRVYPRVEYETLEEQLAAGRHNPAIIAEWNRKTYILDAGSNDTLDFWAGGGYFYCLSMNTGLPYIGLEVWHNGDPAGSVFLQECEVDEYFSITDALDERSPAWLFKSLLNSIEQ